MAADLTGARARNDRAAVERLQNMLISSLDYGDITAWCKAVVRGCKSLLGADKTTMVLPVGGSLFAFSDETSLDEINTFPSRVSPLDAKWSMWDQQLALGAWTRETVWGSWLRDYRRTAYYNEFIVPRGYFDAVGLTVRSGALTARATASTTATIWLHHDRPTGSRFGQRGLQLLQQLLPAFKAGVAVLTRLDAHRASFVRVLDDLGVPLLVASERGDTLHRNPALQKLIAEDPDGVILLAEVVKMAGALSSMHKRVSANVQRDFAAFGDAVARHVRTRTAGYRLRASSAGPELLGVGPLVLVMVEKISSVRWTTTQLHERWELTARQAQVAELIAEGLTYNEIAVRCNISRHTVRRHAEQVRSRLGVHSAAAIAAKLGTTGE